MDETRLDAKTPAHIFAYKALRGIFVASPESSPIRPPPQPQIYLHDDKENTPTPRRSSRFTISPTKSKRKDTDFDSGDAVITFTPKRQKTIPVSPAKSILKNPALPTPRRAGLRDATVTFKDLRVSISPELARRVVPVPVQQPDFSVVKKVEPVEKLKVVKKIDVPKMSDGVKNVEAKVYGEVLDAYKAQTEKEIRRLIKYGQKWKEQAKRQEQRNEELLGMVAELRKENKRLEKRIVQSEQAEKMAREGNALTARRGQSENERCASRVLEKRVTEVDKAVYVRPGEPDETLNLEAKVAKAYGPNLQAKQTRAPTTRHVDTAQEEQLSEDELPISASPPPSKSRPSDLQTQSTTSPKSSAFKSQMPRVEKSADPVPTPASSRMIAALPTRFASDSNTFDERAHRLAAARSRLEARRAGRMTSAPVAATMSKSLSAQEAKSIEVEESQLDWAGL